PRALRHGARAFRPGARDHGRQAPRPPGRAAADGGGLRRRPAPHAGARLGPAEDAGQDQQGRHGLAADQAGPVRMTVHVVGAGLAGLCAATALAEAGLGVEVSEAAGQAGGRCRCYFDAQLGLTIDNGNHLVLSGNPAVYAYLARIGASDRLTGPKDTEFPFVDLATGHRWTVRPNAGPLPWWIFARG